MIKNYKDFVSEGFFDMSKEEMLLNAKLMSLFRLNTGHLIVSNSNKDFKEKTKKALISFKQDFKLYLGVLDKASLKKISEDSVKNVVWECPLEDVNEIDNIIRFLNSLNKKVIIFSKLPAVNFPQTSNVL